MNVCVRFRPLFENEGQAAQWKLTKHKEKEAARGKSTAKSNGAESGQHEVTTI